MKSIARLVTARSSQLCRVTAGLSGARRNEDPVLARLDSRIGALAVLHRLLQGLLQGRGARRRHRSRQGLGRSGAADGKRRLRHGLSRHQRGRGLQFEKPRQGLSRADDGLRAGAGGHRVPQSKRDHEARRTSRASRSERPRTTAASSCFRSFSSTPGSMRRR